MLGVLCATVGSIMATEAVKLITGIGEPLLGRLLMYDALSMEYQTLKLRRRPNRRPITELIDYAVFCGAGTGSEHAHPTTADGAITAPQLRELLDSGENVAVIDVREPVEWDIVRIEGATLIPKDEILSGEALGRLPRDRPLVVHCRTGVRSAEVLAMLRASGFDNARHLHGGITAWAKQVDTSLPVY